MCKFIEILFVVSFVFLIAVFNIISETFVLGPERGEEPFRNPWFRV